MISHMTLGSNFISWTQKNDCGFFTTTEILRYFHVLLQNDSAKLPLKYINELVKKEKLFLFMAARFAICTQRLNNHGVGISYTM